MCLRFQAKQEAPPRKRRFFWMSMILYGWSFSIYIILMLLKGCMKSCQNCRRIKLHNLIFQEIAMAFQHLTCRRSSKVYHNILNNGISLVCTERLLLRSIRLLKSKGLKMSFSWNKI
uniref:Uncharacterized protein n=1 Tax=Opuntia streptacantha TaxID=393608 RepID=A0A7C9AYG5_OPUST